MARSNVPQFGNWESEDNVPYTVYFDKARKTRGGKMINPNDPEENPDMFPNTDPSQPPPKPRTKPEEPIGRGSVRPTTPEHRAIKENGQYNNSPGRVENTGHRNANESNYSGPRPRTARSPRPSAGSEQSFDRSPLHPHYQAKVAAGRGGGSPSWEGKSHDSSHGTPGRSRLRPNAQGDESPDKAAAVPKFGEWDENNPESAENFTQIFNKVREERNTGAGNAPGTPRHPTYGGRGQQVNGQKKCCFPWW